MHFIKKAPSYWGKQKAQKQSSDLFFLTEYRFQVVSVISVSLVSAVSAIVEKLLVTNESN